MKVVNIVGARPNFMKIAPIISQMNRHTQIEHLLLHTGQHYDYEMSQIFFEEFGLAEPDIYLKIGSASHAVQTAKIMIEFEKFALDWQPDLVIVVGDVNSTVACTLTAAKLGISVAHVEAGLRSFDRTMPEEINRIVTDSLADFLFTPSLDANENLQREGVPAHKIFFVGNIMIDTLVAFKEKISRRAIPSELGLSPANYVLLTMHRPSSVDHPETLAGILEALNHLQREIPILFPIHPRTAQRIKDFGLSTLLETMSNLKIVKPLGYLDNLCAMSSAKLVLTDSGGIQEETTFLGVPCLTLRENTERPVTVTEGTNKIIGVNPKNILTETRRLLDAQPVSGSIPALWDGRTAERIVDIILKQCETKKA